MSLEHLSYVSCDICGDPAQPGQGARAARGIARAEGYTREGKADLCARCKPLSGPQRAARRRQVYGAHA